MMCEVMPTISEDTALSQRGSQSSASDPDSHFEQLMVNMLDERDRLLDTLRETQESLGLAQQHLQDVIYDRDALQRQLSSALPQVSHARIRKDGRTSSSVFTPRRYFSFAYLACCLRHFCFSTLELFNHWLHLPMLHFSFLIKCFKSYVVNVCYTESVTWDCLVSTSVGN